MKKEAFIILALVVFVFFFSWIFSEQTVTGATGAAGITGAAAAKPCPCKAKLQISCQDNCFESYSGLKQTCAGSSVEAARACYERASEAYQTCLAACR